MRAATAALALTKVAYAQYTVSVASQPDSPVISFLEGNTAWPQSFNPSYVEPSPGTNGVGGLLVRSQNCSKWTPGQCIGCNVDGSWPIAPYFPGSVITFAKETAPGSGAFEQPYLVFAPSDMAPQNESYGTEDPRLAYDAATGLYHLFYTCYGPGCPKLCHATTHDPTAPIATANWTRLGAVFPDLPCGSKSGALHIMPQPPHYLYWGAGTIALATSNDLVSFTNVNTSFISVRKSMFDSYLVEAGPPPLPLSDGNFIFFHNSANASTVSSDFGSYNPGWVILDGSDPTHIIQRSTEPLLSPSHGWEQGVAPFECNVHNVTFLEAARRVPGSGGQAGPDLFDVWFGGSDAVIGTARIQVTAN